MDKKLYELTLNSCDYRTRIERWLSPEELVFLKELEVSFNEASSYSCMPTLSVKEKVDDK
jgi:hypothetical protein